MVVGLEERVGAVVRCGQAAREQLGSISDRRRRLRFDLPGQQDGIAQPRDDDRVGDDLANKRRLKFLTDLTQETQVAQRRVRLPSSDVDSRAIAEDASCLISYSPRLDSRFGLEMLTYDLGDDADEGERREERSKVKDAAV